jgi:hypothetical protein
MSVSRHDASPDVTQPARGGHELAGALVGLFSLARFAATSTLVAATTSLIVLSIPVPLRAQAPAHTTSDASVDLTELSIEKLRTLKVSSAAKKPQRIIETTAETYSGAAPQRCPRCCAPCRAFKWRGSTPTSGP